MRAFLNVIAITASLILVSCASATPKSTSYINEKGEICRPKTTQIYQPPLKSGGAGRVLNVSTGEDCFKIQKHSDLTKVSGTRIARFESTPPGRYVLASEGVSPSIKNLTAFTSAAQVLANSCTTPCELELDGSKIWHVQAKMDVHEMQSIPLAFNEKSKGTKVHFTIDQPYEFVLSAIEDTAFEMSKATENKDAVPDKRIPPIMPPGATASGHCNLLYDVMSSGTPTNVRIKDCTDQVLAQPSLESVSRYVFSQEKMINYPDGIKNVETRVSYKLLGSDGKLVPEPGVLQ